MTSNGATPPNPGRNRRVRDWLTDSPDAPAIDPAVPATAPSPANRPRKAERRAARRAAFYAERRRAAPGPRALFEVAADQLRALDDERALAAATKAIDAVIARFAP